MERDVMGEVVGEKIQEAVMKLRIMADGYKDSKAKYRKIMGHLDKVECMLLKLVK